MIGYLIIINYSLIFSNIEFWLNANQIVNLWRVKPTWLHCKPNFLIPISRIKSAFNWMYNEHTVLFCWTSFILELVSVWIAQLGRSSSCECEITKLVITRCYRIAAEFCHLDRDHTKELMMLHLLYSMIKVGKMSKPNVRFEKCCYLDVGEDE